MGLGCRTKEISMAKGIVISICILISVGSISAAGVRENNQERRKRTETDLVSNLFSELGNLFLDIDETLTIQTAPKIELEGLVAQLLRPSNEHFRDVQGNYRNLQRRLGTFILQSAPKSSYTAQDLSTIAPPTHKLGSVQDFVTPALSEKVEEPKTVEESEDLSQSSAPLNGISNECSTDILNNPFIEPGRRRECSQRLKRHIHTDNRFKIPVGRKGIESSRKNHLHIPLDTDELYTRQHGFFRRDGDVVESTPKQGRIFGDILYSESSFDKNFRQLLRDHGKWILDNPLLTRWRKASSKDNSDITTEASTIETEIATDSSSDTTPEMESTQAYIPITEDYNTEIPTPVSVETRSENKLPLKSASYYRLINNDGIVGEEVEIVLNPDLNIETVRIAETDGELKMPSPEESVILAFTLDGIPLKLRIGPEIENPSRFLHTVLKYAGTSLNVPVKSHDDIQPVGQEVLKFGAGILTRPAYYDLSNRDDLKNLLKTLMKS